jgi:hypothetical protein|tara:strand:- start:560 stop:892 length:333 start_codon:yes stop_codon:yes gene_type:complete
MHTVSIIKYQGSNFTTIFTASGLNEEELFKQAEKKIVGESLKRYRDYQINKQPRTRLNSGLKIYNVTDVTPSSNDSLGPGTLSYNILINDPGDLKALEQKRIAAGFHAGF